MIHLVYLIGDQTFMRRTTILELVQLPLERRGQRLVEFRMSCWTLVLEAWDRSRCGNIAVAVEFNILYITEQELETETTHKAKSADNKLIITVKRHTEGC